jgi:diadenosine tetraphosphate (Ap4A) HIT family hydrolase
MEGCAFCDIEKIIDESRIIYQDSTWIAILDGYPVSEGHTLLIPKRHCETYFDLNYLELESLGVTIGIVKRLLDTKYHPNGYNVGVNCGEAAGQTIMHCHVHIIPRYNGDCENPRGGVRGVIPNKMSY